MPDKNITKKLQELINLICKDKGGGRSVVSHHNGKYIFEFENHNSVNYTLLRLLDISKSSGLAEGKHGEVGALLEITKNLPIQVADNIVLTNKSGPIQFIFSSSKPEKEIVKTIGRAIDIANNNLAANILEKANVANKSNQATRRERYLEKAPAVFGDSKDIEFMKRCLGDIAEKEFPGCNPAVEYIAKVDTSTLPRSIRNHPAYQKPRFEVTFNYPDEDFSKFNKFYSSLPKIFTGADAVDSIFCEEGKAGVSIAGQPSRLVGDVKRYDAEMFQELSPAFIKER